MLEGYDHDDRYIMVEDEFHSIAQIFTQHLHHAEYRRLKRKARDAAPPTFRPTEATRTETKKKLEARALRAKRKDAVEGMTNVVGLSEGGDEEQEDDPWLGTSLAGLMTDACNQKRTALVGLEKIQSDTRAARGFGRGTGDSPAHRKEKMSVFDIFGKRGKGSEDIVREHELGSSGHERDCPTEANAELLAPSPQEDCSNRQTMVIRKPSSKASESRASTDPTPLSLNSPGRRASTRFREPSVAARRLLDDFDNFEALEKTSDHARKSRPSPSRKDGKTKQKKDRKMQISDIPTFLV